MSEILDTDLLLVERGGVQYKVEHQNLPDLNPDDILLVERGGVQYQVQFQNEGNILDTDLMLVERGGTQYKYAKEGVVFASGPIGWNEWEATYPVHPSANMYHIYYYNGYVYTNGGTQNNTGASHGSAIQTSNLTLDNINNAYHYGINGTYVYKGCNNLGGAQMRRVPRFFHLGNLIHAATQRYCNQTYGNVYSSSTASSGYWSYDGGGPWQTADAVSNNSYAMLIGQYSNPAVRRYNGSTTTGVQTLADGEQWYNWHTHSGGTSLYGEPWRPSGIAYGNGKWVVAYRNYYAPWGTAGGNPDLALQVSTSSSPGTNESSWTSPNLNSSMYNGGYYDVAFGNNTFVAVSYNSAQVAVSTDNGATWSSHSLPSGFTQNRKISFAGEYFFVGQSGKTAFSTDGVTWSVVQNENGGDATVGGREMEIVYDPISEFYFGAYLEDTTWSGNFGSYPYTKNKGQILHYAKRFE